VGRELLEETAKQAAEEEGEEMAKLNLVVAKEKTADPEVDGNQSLEECHDNNRTNLTGKKLISAKTQTPSHGTGIQKSAQPSAPVTCESSGSQS
jgi:hypothetical protein